jgi:hypothetical protein
MKQTLYANVALAALLVSTNAHPSCGAAFCMVNTNWNMQGLAPEAGLRMDLRFEYIDQDQPRAGTSKVPLGAIRRHHDEIRSINRNYVGTLDYTINTSWGIVATAPLIDRTHSHIHNHGGVPLGEQWDFREVGDTQLLVRRQWMSENAATQTLSFYGINFGVKVPTGAFDLRNASGGLAERSLQPGSGTTDMLLGAFYSRIMPASNLSWFVQGLAQVPTAFREHYKSGTRFTLDAGIRHELSDAVGLMLQVNGLNRRRDRGREAEPADTGGSFVFVSPGVSYAITPKTQIYAFVQKPVFQNVRGVQITSDYSLLAGVTSRF